MIDLFNSVQQAQASIRQRFDGKIDSAILLGSGLSGLKLTGYSPVAEFDYQEIDGLPPSTAPTHLGTLSIVTNGEKHIAVGAGRHHLYEGYSTAQISVLAYLFRTLGAHKFFVTNAAGALNPALVPGGVMLINDHINATGRNPLIGQSMSLENKNTQLGAPFPDMSNAYDRELQSRCFEVATKLNIQLESGVYVGVLGPSLETSAERRMLRSWGGDAVGMSTVTEVIAAVHSGMQVLGLSAITNFATGSADQQPDSIDQIIENAALAGQSIEKLLNELIE